MPSVTRRLSMTLFLLLRSYAEYRIMPSGRSALRQAGSYKGIELGIIRGRSETSEARHRAETAAV
jgi:hypothetical protein